MPDEEEGYTIPPPPDYVLGPEGVLIDPTTGRPAPEGARLSVTTAFAVVVGSDGTMWATTDLNVLNIMDLRRTAGIQDMVPACAQIIQDLQTMKTVQQTVSAMMQTSQAIAEQQRVQGMAQKLSAKGIRLPR